MPRSSEENPRIFYGWWVVVAFASTGIYWTGTHNTGLSALFTPMRESFGFSASVITFAISLKQILTMFVSPVVGQTVDRVGPRRFLILAGILGGAGFSIVALAHSTWMFFVGFVIASLGYTIIGSGMGPAVISAWFKKRQGMTIALIMGLGGLSGFFVPGIVWIEGEFGWRTAAIAIAIGTVAVTVPMAFVIRRTPQEMGLQPDNDEMLVETPPGTTSKGQGETRKAMVTYGVKELLHNHFFLITIVAQVLFTIGNATANLFLIPHLEEQGFSREASAWIATVVGVVGTIGIVSIGWYSDRVGRRSLLLACMALQVVGLVVFAYVSSFPMVIVYIVCNGIGGRVVFSLVSSTLLDQFGSASAGKILGILMAIFAFSSFLGPQLAALVHDELGSYTPMLLAYAGTACLSIALTVFGSRYMRKAA